MPDRIFAARNLRLSIKRNDARRLQSLLQQHPHQITTPLLRARHTPVTYATHRRAHQSLDVLLAHHAPPDLRAARATLPTALCIACANADPIAVALLLRAAADVRWRSARRFEPLHYAVLASANGHNVIDIVRMLVQRGALDGWQDEMQTDVYPLRFAVRFGAHHVLMWLLQYPGVLQKMHASGTAALACSIGDVDVVHTLLATGFDVAVVDVHGQTLLHHAMHAPFSNVVALVRILLQAGVDHSIRDMFGRTPLGLAKQRCLVPVVMMLRAHGADEESYSSVLLRAHTASASDSALGDKHRFKYIKTPTGTEAFEKAIAQPGQICVICRDELGSDSVLATPCKHLFHEHCLREWISTRASCPLCNAQLQPACRSTSYNNGFPADVRGIIRDEE